MQEHTPEFFKLDSTDRKVLFWMMDYNPGSLSAWIEYISKQYARNRSVSIDAELLFNEVIIDVPEEKDSLKSRSTWRPKNILLVDDETLFNFLHKRILQLTRVSDEVQTALNGKEAIEFLKSCSQNNSLPDIILLDLSMPVMDGFAFLEAFQKLELPNKERINIIVITSSLNERDRLKARSMGVNHYLIKPVDERELCSAVIA